MNVIEINKYKPALMKHGRYLREDWISYSNIGETYDGVTLTRDEYLRVEDSYLAAIKIACDFASVRSLFAHDLERWDADSETLRRFHLDDVLDGSPQVTEGQPLTGARLENVLRRCMREVAWLEFVVPNSFLIHLSHDMRLFVALEADPTLVKAKINELGLFTYDGTTRLPTLDEWRFGVSG